MAKKNDITNLTELPLKCMSRPDPMLSMLEWLCKELMEAEASAQPGAEKSVHSGQRISSRSGYRPRRLNTRMGTMYLMIPKVRSSGYSPFFITERKRSKAALIPVVQGVSTRKMDKPARSLGIEGLSHSQVSEMTKGLNEQAEVFRNRSLAGKKSPILWTDALYENVRFDEHVVSMAILPVCGVNRSGTCEAPAIQPMPEESCETYRQLFNRLKECGLKRLPL